MLATPNVLAAAFNQVTLRGVYHQDLAPYSYLDPKTGKMAGILVDLMEALTDAANITVSHTGYPWARAQSMVASTSADALICPVTSERMEYAVFAPTPLTTLAPAEIFFDVENPNALAIKATKRKEDLYRFATVDYIGNSTGDTIWRDHPQRIRVSDIDTTIAMLYKGRADFILADPVVTRTKLRELGLLSSFMSVPAGYVTGSHGNKMQFGLRKSFPGAYEIVERVDRIIASCINKDMQRQTLARHINAGIGFAESTPHFDKAGCARTTIVAQASIPGI